MSVWIKCEDRMPPLHEEVLVLYKYKEDELSQNNLYYGIAERVIHKPFPSSKGWEDWSYFIDCQGYYEVVYWTPLIDMPSIDKEGEEDANSN